MFLYIQLIRNSVKLWPELIAYLHACLIIFRSGGGGSIRTLVRPSVEYFLKSVREKSNHTLSLYVGTSRICFIQIEDIKQKLMQK